MAAARVQQVLSKTKAAVEPALCSARNEAVKRFDAYMVQNQQYVVKDPEAANKLLKQYVVTNVSRLPNTISTCKTEAAEWRKTMSRFSSLPLPEMASYLAFGGELFAIFCVGEIVGRGFTFSGYSV